MQEFQIQEIESVVSPNEVWTRQSTGASGGKYTFNGQVRKYEDFICLNGYRILTVLKVNGLTNGELSGNTFKINELITCNVTDRVINRFHIELGQLIVTSGNIKMTLATVKKKVKAASKVVKTNTKEAKQIEDNEVEVFIKLRTQIEQQFKGRFIRLEKTLRKRKETPLEFLVKFFKEGNNEKKTVWVDTAEVQTTTGRRRSLGDIYMIMKYYYSNITVNEVLDMLYNKLPAKITPGFRTCYCNTIKKRVWYYQASLQNDTLNSDTLDEFGHPYSYYTTRIQQQ